MSKKLHMIKNDYNQWSKFKGVKNKVRYENRIDRVFWKKFGSDYIKIPPLPLNRKMNIKSIVSGVIDVIGDLLWLMLLRFILICCLFFKKT